MIMMGVYPNPDNRFQPWFTIPRPEWIPEWLPLSPPRVAPAHLVRRDKRGKADSMHLSCFVRRGTIPAFPTDRGDDVEGHIHAASVYGRTFSPRLLTLLFAVQSRLRDCCYE